MSSKRYREEFKIEAVKQVTERNYKISEVARRLGVTTKSLHDWIKKYGDYKNRSKVWLQTGADVDFAIDPEDMIP